MPAYESFHIGGRDGNANPNRRTQAEPGRKRGAELSDGWIVHLHDSFAQRGMCSTWPPAEGFLMLRLRQEPERFPKTHSGGHAEQQCTTRLDQSGEVAGSLCEIAHAVQACE